MELNFRNFLNKNKNCNICQINEISLGILHSIFVDKNDIETVIEKYKDEYYRTTNLKLEKKDIESHINKHVMINELTVAIANANKEQITFIKNPIVPVKTNAIVNHENRTFYDIIKELDSADEKIKYTTKILEEKLNKIVEQSDADFKHIADKVALNKVQSEALASYIKNLRDGQLHEVKISKLSNIDRELELKSIFLALKQCFVTALADIPLSEELKQKFNNVFQTKVAENFKSLKLEFFNNLIKDKKQKF